MKIVIIFLIAEISSVPYQHSGRNASGTENSSWSLPSQSGGGLHRQDDRAKEGTHQTHSTGQRTKKSSSL